MRVSQKKVAHVRPLLFLHRFLFMCHPEHLSPDICEGSRQKIIARDSSFAAYQRRRQNDKSFPTRKNIAQQLSAEFVYRVKRQKHPDKFFDPPFDEFFHTISMLGNTPRFQTRPKH